MLFYGQVELDVKVLEEVDLASFETEFGLSLRLLPASVLLVSEVLFVDDVVEETFLTLSTEQQVLGQRAEKHIKN